MSELERQLGLIDISPVEAVFKDPTSSRLKAVPKALQTYEMLLLVCSNDGNALKHASKKLITPELCEIALKENGLALQFVPDKIISTAGTEWVEDICKIAVPKDGLALQYVPDDKKTKEIVTAAIGNDGRALQYVPSHLMSKEIVEASLLGDCSRFNSGYHISCVPKELLPMDLLIRAVEHFPFYLGGIPNKRITKRLAEIAVLQNGLSLRFIPGKHITPELVFAATAQNAMAIRYVPQEYITAEMCMDCFDRNCAVLPFLPAKFITKEMCLQTIEKHRFFVTEMLDYRKEEVFGTKDVDLVEFKDFPEKLRNDRDILDAIIQIYVYGSVPLLKWNEELVKDLERYPISCTNKRNEQIEPLQKKTIAYLKKKAIATPIEEEQSAKNELLTAIMKSNLIGYAKKSALSPPADFPPTYQLVPYDYDTAIAYDLSSSDSAIQKVYYVSDIHIEHQLPEELKKIPISKKMDFTMEFLNRKVSELVSEVPESRDSILLIAGDVADNIYLTEIFYEILRQQWKGGTIISVLGNHELWETTSADEIVRRAVASALNPDFKHRAVEPIVEDYKKVINRGWWLHRRSIGHDRPTTWGLSNELYVNSVLLENELYICYQGRISRVLHEAEILDAPVEELTDLLSKCTFILLGGIGFSGLNPKWNAESGGIYCDTITTIEEDKLRTERFRRIYEKVESSAADRKVIVLTHTPVYDWTNARCNKNWIYVNGHTHQNILCLDEDTTVFADNQIGYKQQKWKLNSFTIDKCRYDPFSEYEDGIYEITSDQYKDFNRGRGILSNGCNHEGTLYMLKRNELYMFLLQSTKSLNLMAGGQRKKLDRKDIRYYYDNMVLYSEMVRRKSEPYQKVLRSLSKEIKQIGGIGTIHGCIVDISFFSHLYVNPLDGKITPYWAMNIISRLPYDNFQSFLEDNEPELLHKYLLEKGHHSLPLLSTYTSANDCIPDSALIPEWMYGTEIYQQSRIIKAIQYVWEQDVIRIWNDEILREHLETTKTSLPL